MSKLKSALKRKFKDEPSNNKVNVEAGDILLIGTEQWIFATEEFEEASIIRIIKPTKEQYAITDLKDGAKKLALKLCSISYSQMNLNIKALAVENIHSCDINVLNNLAPFYLASITENGKKIIMMDYEKNIVKTDALNKKYPAILYSFISRDYINYNEEKNAWEIKPSILSTKIYF